MSERTIRCFYPLQSGTLVLRTSADWGRDVEPTAVDRAAGRYEFTLRSRRSYLELKACIRDGGHFAWAEGRNKVVAMTTDTPRDIYPYFSPGARGTLGRRRTLVSDHLGRPLELRIYYPPGYEENPLKRYPVIYMHDGRNLFFPEEAFLGREWQIDETLDRLDAMNLIDQVLVVGVHTRERQHDYTRPGYETFARALVEELKPAIDGRLRTLPEPRWTAVMGSSLGGVAAFHLAWQHPEVFGNAACLSATFGYRDDLAERLRDEGRDDRRRELRLYLDSGWPGDNYEATLAMAHGLMEAGFEFGRQFLHFAFPLAQHNESAWAARSHIPIQLFSGKLAVRGLGE